MGGGAVILTVTVPNVATFAAYYYGGADEVLMRVVEGLPTYTLVYSDPGLARAQEARFASGLYFASLVDEDPTAGFTYPQDR